MQNGPETFDYLGWVRCPQQSDRVCNVIFLDLREFYAMKIYHISAHETIRPHLKVLRLENLIKTLLVHGRGMIADNSEIIADPADWVHHERPDAVRVLFRGPLVHSVEVTAALGHRNGLFFYCKRMREVMVKLMVKVESFYIKCRRPGMP